MCRNIKTLFNFEPPATELEIRDASLQFVRKLSGFNVPSKANEVVFERAVEDVARAARALIAELVTHAEPRDRETEAAKARVRNAARFRARRLSRPRGRGMLPVMPLETLELQTGDAPAASLVILHGLGADGQDFVPIARELDPFLDRPGAFRLSPRAGASGDDQRRHGDARLVRHPRC